MSWVRGSRSSFRPSTPDHDCLIREDIFLLKSKCFSSAQSSPENDTEEGMINRLSNVRKKKLELFRSINHILEVLRRFLFQRNKHTSVARVSIGIRSVGQNETHERNDGVLIACAAIQRSNVIAHLTSWDFFRDWTVRPFRSPA